MPDGCLSDYGNLAPYRGRIAVQVFDWRECSGHQYYRNLLYLLSVGRALFLQGGIEPQIYMGNVSWRGVFCDHMCSVCCVRSRLCANQQHRHHDIVDLPWQWDAGRNDGIAHTYFTDTGTMNFVKILSFLSKYVILAKELFVLLIT